MVSDVANQKDPIIFPGSCCFGILLLSFKRQTSQTHPRLLTSRCHHVEDAGRMLLFSSETERALGTKKKSATQEFQRTWTFFLMRQILNSWIVFSSLEQLACFWSCNILRLMHIAWSWCLVSVGVQADSVKNQYEHFLSLLQAHCSMVAAPVHVMALLRRA